MKINVFYIVSGGVFLLILIVSVIWFAGNDYEVVESGQILQGKEKNVHTGFPDTRLSGAAKGESTSQRMLAYLLEAFEAADGQELRRRVREMLEEDLLAALAVISQLDYTLLHYDMVFPHDVVSGFLAEQFEDPEVMEMMSVYIDDSSILNSVMTVYFVDWAERDAQAQMDWLRENNTFNDQRILAKYVEAIGALEVGQDIVRMLGELPDDDSRKLYYHGKGMEFLAGNKPEEFVSYIKSLDEIPPHADEALINLTYGMSRNAKSVEDMDRLVEWVETISDDGQWQTSLAAYSAQFSHSYPEAFEEWFSGLEFSDANTKQAIYEQVQQMKEGIVSDELEGVSADSDLK